MHKENIMSKGYVNFNNIINQGYYPLRVTGNTDCNFYKKKMKENFYHKDECKKVGCNG